MSSYPARSRARPLVALLATGMLTLSACSSGSSEPEQSTEEVLAAAKQTLDETPGVRIDLATEALPEGVSGGIVSAEGLGAHPPAFEGDLKVQASGVTADVAVVAVDGVVYAKLPFTTEFAEVDPGDYGAPDPANLMRPEGGLSSLLTQTQDPERGDPARAGELVVTEYTGTLPGGLVSGIIPSASADEDFDATYQITEDNVLRQTVLTGPFYPDAADVTYTITFDEYDTQAEISAP